MSDIVERMRIAAKEAETETHLDYDPGFAEAADEIERLRNALLKLKKLGEEGMKPDYQEWLTFHDKVAKTATEALQ